MNKSLLALACFITTLATTNSVSASTIKVKNNVSDVKITVYDISANTRSKTIKRNKSGNLTLPKKLKKIEVKRGNTVRTITPPTNVAAKDSTKWTLTIYTMNKGGQELKYIEPQISKDKASKDKTSKKKVSKKKVPKKKVLKKKVSKKKK